MIFQLASSIDLPFEPFQFGMASYERQQFYSAKNFSYDQKDRRGRMVRAEVMVSGFNKKQRQAAGTSSSNGGPFATRSGKRPDGSGIQGREGAA
jgi:hypothetical protein